MTENERVNVNRDLRLLFLPHRCRHVHSGCEEMDKIHAEGRIERFEGSTEGCAVRLTSIHGTGPSLGRGCVGGFKCSLASVSAG